MPPYCELHEMYHHDPYECRTLRVAADLARDLAARRAKAEQIARRVADEAWHEEPGNITGPEQSRNYNMRLNAARAAALAALTETENAR